MIEFLQPIIGWLTSAFLMVLGIIVLIMLFLAISDVLQTKDAVRKNYPLIGRFRYLFSSLGEFFRQYFFAMDREEMPFNRAEREWVHKATENSDNTVAFGSTKSLSPPGTVIFVNCPFPTLDADATKTETVVVGPRCANPYQANSIFNISGMSFGALSRPAVTALARGAKEAGCWMNTGEGGLSPYHDAAGCDIVFQIGTAKYGVRNDDGSLNDDKLRALAEKDNIKMFEIKMSQGAKPGKGGILPGGKVTQEIADIRGIPMGEASISPNRHPEINSVDEMLDFIAHVKEVTQKPVGFKAVVGSYGWLEKLCKRIHERGVEKYCPDFITIDSGDGGTGAAPMPLMDNVGLTVRESLPLVVDIIKKYGLRDEIKLVASGKLITPSEVAWAISSGADFVTSARGFMFSLGCIQALKCNQNTCPTGITTHNKRLQKGLNPEEKYVKVANYQKNLSHEVEVLAHSCGVGNPRQLRRFHVRVVQHSGKSAPMDDLFPEVETLPEYAKA